MEQSMELNAKQVRAIAKTAGVDYLSTWTDKTGNGTRRRVAWTFDCFDGVDAKHKARVMLAHLQAEFARLGATNEVKMAHKDYCYVRVITA